MLLIKQHAETVGFWVAINARMTISSFFFNKNLDSARYHQEIPQPFFNELRDDELEAGYFQRCKNTLN